MTVQAKICGINDATAMQTAVANGAGFVGLVFYPQSPRSMPWAFMLCPFGTENNRLETAEVL